nr:MAG TPA: hypothetical protein [Caudoviricetes sp.]
MAHRPPPLMCAACYHIGNAQSSMALSELQIIYFFYNLVDKL